MTRDTVEAASPANRRVVARGTIQGHEAGGSVVIERSSDGDVVRLEDYWIAEGAPDARVYLTPDRTGRVDVPGGVSFERITSFSGTLAYAIPSDIATEEIGAVVVYCAAFSVTFGIAVLEHAGA